MITSAAGIAIQLQVQRAFLALRELDKHAPAEVSEILAATLSFAPTEPRP